LSTISNSVLSQIFVADERYRMTGGLVGAQVFPDVLHRVQSRRIGWQRDQQDVVWDPEFLIALMPTGVIADQRRDGARCDPGAFF